MARREKQCREFELLTDDKGHARWQQKAAEVSNANAEARGSALPPDAVLAGNPFFYSPGKGEVPVHDLEQFRLPDRKDGATLGMAVRSPDMSRRKKKRIVKRAFTHWKRDVLLSRKKSEEKNDAILEAARPIHQDAITPGTFIVSLLACLVLILIVGTSSSLWYILSESSHVLSTIASSLANAFQSHAFFDACAHVDLYLFILLFSYLPLYSIIVKSYRNRYNETKHVLERAYRDLDRTALKRWARARKYYLVRLNRPDLTFTPLLMSRVEEGNISLSALEDISTATLEQKAGYAKTRRGWVFARKALVALSIALFLPVFIFAIAETAAGLV